MIGPRFVASGALALLPLGLLGCGGSDARLANESNWNLKVLAEAIVVYRDERQAWPETLSDVQTQAEQIAGEYGRDRSFAELTMNPATGDDPGYEYVAPKPDVVDSQATLYQLRGGKRDLSLAVAFSTGEVRELPQEEREIAAGDVSEATQAGSPPIAAPDPDQGPAGSDLEGTPEAGGVGAAEGFPSPDAALDAYGESLVEGDVDAYRQAAKHVPRAISGLEAIVQMQLRHDEDMSPEEAARINLQAMAPLHGFGDVPSKRFPAETQGDEASIVQVFEREIAFEKEVEFRRFRFSRSNGSWSLVDVEGGSASELPSRFAWNSDAAPSDPPQSPSGDVGDADREIASGDPIMLFNGVDLAGWTPLWTKYTKNRQNETWSVDAERGVLICNGKDRNELATVESFRDFDLRLEWRWRPGSPSTPNGSGVVIRSNGLAADQANPQGLEIDIRPTEEPKLGLGVGSFIAYDMEAKNPHGSTDGVENRMLGWIAEPPKAGEDGWNELRISCRGDRATVISNGQFVNEAWDLSSPEGKIVLRNQNTGIEFRAIELTEQDASATSPAREPGE